MKRFIAGMSVCLPLIILWARTGLVSAASVGDEVWWSESGYHFLREGVLRWAFLNDDKGSAFLSFWPPVAPLLQAFLIKVFGLNAFGICAQSSLVSTMMMLGVFLLCRKLKVDRSQALFTSAAIFGLLTVDRGLTAVKMENLTALSAVFYAILILRCAEIKDPQAKFILGAFAGFVMGIGLFAYYPHSPFLLLACFAAIFSLGESAAWTAFSTGIGTLPVVAAGALWIGPHWTLFQKQILNVGARYYFSPWNAVAAISKIGSFPHDLAAAGTIEKLCLLFLSIVGIVAAKTKPLKMVAVMTFILSFPMFFYKETPQVGAGVLGVVLLFGFIQENRSPGLTKTFKAAASILIMIAEIKFALLGLTAYWQFQGRSYREVSKALRQWVKPSGPVAISQSAWLGLREIIPSEELCFLVYAGPSLENMPRIAKYADADDYFAYLVLERDTLPTLKKIYPWLKRGIVTGKFYAEKEITLPFKPLPWARHPSYDLIVYKRVHTP